MEIIPLGSTCSVAYQLRKLGLRNYAFPFDWVRINNLSTVTDLIENNFLSFLDLQNYKFLEISDKFEVNKKMKSYIYQNQFCRFYHEFDRYIDSSNFTEFKEKYHRRINRFFEIIKDSKKILFIREEIGNLSSNKIKKFSKLINELNPYLNWKLKIIVNKEKYLSLKSENVEVIYSSEKVTNWTRPELNWSSIFLY